MNTDMKSCELDKKAHFAKCPDKTKPIFFLKLTTVLTSVYFNNTYFIFVVVMNEINSSQSSCLI